MDINLTTPVALNVSLLKPIETSNINYLFQIILAFIGTVAALAGVVLGRYLQSKRESEDLAKSQIENFFAKGGVATENFAKNLIKRNPDPSELWISALKYSKELKSAINIQRKLFESSTSEQQKDRIKKDIVKLEGELEKIRDFASKLRDLCLTKDTRYDFEKEFKNLKESNSRVLLLQIEDDIIDSSNPFMAKNVEIIAELTAKEEIKKKGWSWRFWR